MATARRHWTNSVLFPTREWAAKLLRLRHQIGSSIPAGYISPLSSQASTIDPQPNVLGSSREIITDSDKNEGSNRGSRDSVSATPGSRGGSFDLFFGRTSPTSTLLQTNWPLQPNIEEIEAKMAMDIPFSVFRALFSRDAKSRMDMAGREPQGSS